jgi:tetratricopeptide (TPR) repeat protein
MMDHQSYKKSGERIESLLEKSRWVEARALIRKELKQTPSDHWLMTRLGMTYYEQRHYKKALEVIQRALKLTPRCPLVLWDYASCLDMLEREQEAIHIWRRLMRRGIDAVAYGPCGEGKRWARALINDCRYRLGLAFADIGNRRAALYYLHRHLKNRVSSRGSIYGAQDVKKKLNWLEQGFNPRYPRRKAVD